MAKKGQPIYAARHPRPHVWRSGPDPVDHEIYKTWLTTRAQASYRDELWELTWEQYRDIWRPHFHLRGRDSDNLCLARKNYHQAWRQDNVELITRAENASRHSKFRLEINNIARENGTYVKRTRVRRKK